jgi:hypothetical protein
MTQELGHGNVEYQLLQADAPYPAQYQARLSSFMRNIYEAWNLSGLGAQDFQTQLVNGLI